jgi:hypothetical protein
VRQASSATADNHATSSLRVFIGPVNVASYYSGLAAGLRELDVDVELVLFAKYQHFRSAPRGRPSRVLNLLDWCVDRVYGVKPCRKLAILTATALLPFARVITFFWSLTRFDVFVFGAAKGFFSLYELPLLKLFGKRLIFVFNGSESRPAYIGKWAKGADSEKVVCKAIRRAARQKRRIQWIERFADVCISHAPQAHFHEKRYIDHCAVGHPVVLSEPPNQPEVPAKGPNSKVRILHAPSVLGPKGTDGIRKIISTLKAAAFPIEYVELRGRPNHEVIEELLRCDFVVDQLYSDIPLAGFATEAAFFGKPAAVGGYALETLQSFHGSSQLPIETYVRPENAEDLVRRLIVDPEFRKKCGDQSRDFVRNSWNARTVAARFLQIIEGTIPDAWWIAPNDLYYLHGFGDTEEVRREFVRRVLETEGRPALQLSDKPELEQLFVDFAFATAQPASADRLAA